MRKLTLEHEAQRGVRAKHILEDEVYRDAWNAVEASIVDRWKSSPIADAEGQQKLRMMLHVMASVRRQLEDTMDTGKLASAQIEEEQSMRAKVLRTLGF